MKALLVIAVLVSAYLAFGWLYDRWEKPRRKARWDKLREEARIWDESPEGRAEQARLIARWRDDRRRRQTSYAEYLRSPWWQHISASAKTAAQHRCQGCGTGERLEVHHKTYSRRGREQLEDLEVLCHACHRAQHPDRVADY
jgi:5-methylcytosine-specific restriction endonuclease McrA